MFEVIDREPVEQFIIPEDASGARIVSSFSGNVSDRQFIFTVKPVGGRYADDHKFEELSWSTSLNSSFEYVGQVQENTTFLGRSFVLEPGIDVLEISCIEWKKTAATSGVTVTSLALELFSKEWNFPLPFKQLITPGRII